ncbi:YndM family protein [Bacillus sp. B15-48]|uniref:YndM family protein n=1 Tax=Bacillus sp. B15-48 TaxID=1548601 RepID=UPI00193FD09D|nr:YndM family protein [Bacillus sp. B15-48]MBM4760924.1 DUF2512 family protein [Bacillus sp. B15-48]
MKHLWALLIKFTAIAIVLFSLFAIFNTATFGEILFMSVFITLLAYFVGDLIILPKFGNAIATIADFGLSFVTILFLSIVLFGRTEGMLWMSFTAAAAIAAVEALFHLYMKNHVLSDRSASFVPGVYREDKMTTEFSEELDANETKDIFRKYEKE